ncbi:hypothetical protein ANANG_G00002420 [Anguilla anguilla]|uniref:Uncharacterized protein n=1 Tax=Anguilla anguilla TaxID=7936 RepID=A0A9D3MVC7_ANGAN|nr:hypothetical protein ANANG_G00002420 [Anguilla anguilla]
MYTAVLKGYGHGTSRDSGGVRQEGTIQGEEGRRDEKRRVPSVDPGRREPGKTQTDSLAADRDPLLARADLLSGLAVSVATGLK